MAGLNIFFHMCQVEINVSFEEKASCRGSCRHLQTQSEKGLVRIRVMHRSSLMLSNNSTPSEILPEIILNLEHFRVRSEQNAPNSLRLARCNFAALLILAAHLGPVNGGHHLKSSRLAGLPSFSLQSCFPLFWCGGPAPWLSCGGEEPDRKWNQQKESKPTGAAARLW